MCGIVGIVGKYAQSCIGQSTNIISHRGPDDTGIFVDQDIAFGHQRLSIQDLSSAGHQPIQTDDGSVLMIFNGEIYNHQEIRNQLSKGHKYRSHSDTETILHAFQEMGTDIFPLLNGIFAIAFYDKKNQKLTISRDQFGVKPLYFYHDDQQFFFGSEIKSFLNIPDWNREIDYAAINNYLHFLYSPGVKTPFKYIHKLEAGHYLEFDLKRRNSIKKVKFYDIPFDGNYIDASEKEIVEELEIKLKTAVKRQMLSDVPIGFFLSGGLDSSAIVALAKEYSEQKLHCYTINTDFELNNKEGFANDLFYAKKVAEKLDIDLEIVNADVDIVSDFDKMIWHLDEPQADAAPLNLFNISKQARDSGSVVLLGGTGGDDLFTGYRRHQALQYETYLKAIPNWLGVSTKSIFSKFGNNNAKFRRINKILKDVDKDSLSRMAGYWEWLPLKQNKALFSKNVFAQIRNNYPSDILKNSLSNIKGETSQINQMLYWEMKFFLADHNLNYTDKLGMATGVEIRVPFLDKDLVEFSTKIPTNYKIKGKETKYILKKTMGKYLPNEVIYRPKTGFGAPVRKWITEDLDDMINDRLSQKKINERGIFNYKSIKKLIIENRNGKIDASYSIWSLLAIDSWMNQFNG